MSDFCKAEVVMESLDAAVAINETDPLRHGAVINIHPPGRVVMTGDLHDHTPNFLSAVRLAALDAHPGHHLILQELVHGPHLTGGRDCSIRLLARAAALRVRYPRQVHVLLSNHELAQVLGQDILKARGATVGAFDDGLDYIFGDDSDAVRAAMSRYVRSLPLAVRLHCSGGILCAHSLPSQRFMDTFDTTILDRRPTADDFSPDGPAYQMVWGRSHQDCVARKLAAAWGVRWFVVGHQPVEMGHRVECESVLVLASDHNHGVALPLDLSRQYDMQSMVEALVPLAG